MPLLQREIRVLKVPLAQELGCSWPIHPFDSISRVLAKSLETLEISVLALRHPMHGHNVDVFETLPARAGFPGLRWTVQGDLGPWCFVLQLVPILLCWLVPLDFEVRMEGPASSGRFLGTLLWREQEVQQVNVERSDRKVVRGGVSSLVCQTAMICARVSANKQTSHSSDMGMVRRTRLQIRETPANRSSKVVIVRYKDNGVA